MAERKAVTTASGERALQRLAVNRHHARPRRPQILDEPAETASERRRVQQPEDPRKRIVARNAVLKGQKLAEQILTVNREIRKVRAVLGTAHRRRQRHRQHLQQVVALGVASARIGQTGKRLLKPGRQHETPRSIAKESPIESILSNNATTEFQMRFPWSQGRCGEQSALGCVHAMRQLNARPTVQRATDARYRF